MTRYTGILMAVLVGIASISDSAFPQSEYDEKALRVKTGFWSAKIVAGASADEVAKLGSFPSLDIVPYLSERSDEAAQLYLQYRSRQIQSSLLVWGGLAAIIAGLIVQEDNNGAAAGLVLGGLCVQFVGFSRSYAAADRLYRAIWEYNRTFASE